jgi:hypothetical protein
MFLRYRDFFCRDRESFHRWEARMYAFGILACFVMMDKENEAPYARTRIKYVEA